MTFEVFEANGGCWEFFKVRLPTISIFAKSATVFDTNPSGAKVRYSAISGSEIAPFVQNFDRGNLFVSSPRFQRQQFHPSTLTLITMMKMARQAQNRLYDATDFARVASLVRTSFKSDVRSQTGPFALGISVGIRRRGRIGMWRSYESSPPWQKFSIASSPDFFTLTYQFLFLCHDLLIFPLSLCIFLALSGTPIVP